jgi:hypothetical protein
MLLELREPRVDRTREVAQGSAKQYSARHGTGHWRVRLMLMPRSFGLSMWVNATAGIRDCRNQPV